MKSVVAAMIVILAPLWIAAAVAIAHAYVTRDSKPEK